jgi:hypothetical protein
MRIEDSEQEADWRPRAAAIPRAIVRDGARSRIRRLGARVVGQHQGQRRERHQDVEIGAGASATPSGEANAKNAAAATGKAQTRARLSSFMRFEVPRPLDPIDRPKALRKHHRVSARPRVNSY